MLRRALIFRGTPTVMSWGAVIVRGTPDALRGALIIIGMLAVGRALPPDAQKRAPDIQKGH